MLRLAIGALLIAPDARAVMFHGVDHQPVGATTVSLVDSLLLVSGMSGTGLDGVTVTAPANCTGYYTLFDSIRVNPGGYWRLSALSGSDVSSSLTMRRVGPDSTHMEAGFLGIDDTSTVIVSAYLNGSLVRSRLIHPAVATSFATGTVSPEGTQIVPIILLVAVVIGILSDSREYHIFLPNDPPGVYTKQVVYTFLGFGLAHPATGRIPGDAQIITFDKLVVSPVRKFSTTPYITSLAYTGSNVQAFKMGSNAFSLGFTAPPVLPATSRQGLILAALTLALAGGWIARRRSRRSEQAS